MSEDRRRATGVGAVVMFSADPAATVAFYRAIGIDLASEDHGDGVVHHAAQVGDTHVAVFASSDGDAGASPFRAPPFRSGGCSLVGFRVDSVAACVEAVRALGADVVMEPAEFPWGLRAVVLDPDGRSVEVFEPSPG